MKKLIEGFRRVREFNKAALRLKSIKFNKAKPFPTEAHVILYSKSPTISVEQDRYALKYIATECWAKVPPNGYWMKSMKFHDTELAPTLHIKDDALYGKLDQSIVEPVPVVFDYSVHYNRFTDERGPTHQLVLYVTIQLQNT